MELDEYRKAIEAILLVSDVPVEPSLLAQLLEVPKADIESNLLRAHGRIQER